MDILISSNCLGRGDDSLGEALMKSYLYALSENEALPNNIIFINSGVKLAAEGSNVIESLNVLSSKGVKISCCGTCLDFFYLKDKLLVGEVTNMYTIVDIMKKSEKVINL